MGDTSLKITLQGQTAIDRLLVSFCTSIFESRDKSRMNINIISMTKNEPTKAKIN
jgi:hypothetical protein